MAFLGNTVHACLNYHQHLSKVVLQSIPLNLMNKGCPESIWATLKTNPPTPFVYCQQTRMMFSHTIEHPKRHHQHGNAIICCNISGPSQTIMLLSISLTAVLEMEVHLLYWPQDMIECWNGSYFLAPRLFGFKETSLSQDQVFVISLFSPSGLGFKLSFLVPIY